MDVLRKAFLANVDDIYRLADEYAETYDISVQVKETASRGYYLSVSADLGPRAGPAAAVNSACEEWEVHSLQYGRGKSVQCL